MVDADRNDMADASFQGPFKNLISILVKSRHVQMGMAVDEHLRYPFLVILTWETWPFGPGQRQSALP
jgi:hypothetical protein